MPSDVAQPLQQIPDDVQPTTSDNPDSHMPSPGYVSPSDVHPYPKATRRKTKAGRKKGSTKILTDTQELQELAAIFESRKRKATSTAKKPKKCLFKTKEKNSYPPTKSKTPTLSSSEGDNSEVEYNDESDVDSDTPIIEGDFVVIKCAGKSRFVHYIARVDVLSGDEFEGVFLHNVAGKVGSDRPVFVPDTDDEAAFDLDEVVRKLPQPKTVGSSSRCAGQLVFSCDLSEWHLT